MPTRVGQPQFENWRSSKQFNTQRFQRALCAAIFDPIWEVTGTPKPGTTIHLCTDSELYLVPMDALPLKEAHGLGPADYPERDVARLGDIYRIRHEHSFGRIVRPARSIESEPSLLVVGGLDYDAKVTVEYAGTGPPDLRLGDRERTSLWGAWHDLEYSFSEADVISKKAKRLLGIDATILTGAEATENDLQGSREGQTLRPRCHPWLVPSKKLHVNCRR